MPRKVPENVRQLQEDWGKLPKETKNIFTSIAIGATVGLLLLLEVDEMARNILKRQIEKARRRH